MLPEVIFRICLEMKQRNGQTFRCKGLGRFPPNGGFPEIRPAHPTTFRKVFYATAGLTFLKERRVYYEEKK
jgi:hypothetical protein